MQFFTVKQTTIFREKKNRINHAGGTLLKTWQRRKSSRKDAFFYRLKCILK